MKKILAARNAMYLYINNKRFQYTLYWMMLECVMKLDDEDINCN